MPRRSRVPLRERLYRARTRDEAAAAAEAAELDYRLTPRERQVIELYARGLRRTEIARELGIKPDTVNGYAKRARWLLGARTIAQAVLIAQAKGVISPPYDDQA